MRAASEHVRVDRVDALANEGRDRFAVLTGATLDPEKDPVLQDLATEAGKVLDIPIALVSLVLERTQFFRARVGLPEDLEIAAATDRDVSFCQFVVRDRRRFEVNDAGQDQRVPQELVVRYGIGAYIGEPVYIDGKVVGSLCGIDTKPRVFDDHQRAKLEGLAVRASQRLEVLARRGGSPSSELLGRGLAPTFMELRNILTPFEGNIVAARIAVTELGPLRRLADDGARSGATTPVLAVLSKAASAVDDLAEILADLDEGNRRLQATALAIERLIRPARSSCSVAEAMELSSRLAHHQVKLVGGVTWAPVSPDLRVALSRALVSSVLSMALSALDRGHGPLEGSAVVSDSIVSVRLSCPRLNPIEMAEAAKSLIALMEDDPRIVVQATESALTLDLPRAS